MAKKEQVSHMFDQIAWRYDFLNHLLTMRIDKIWRRKAVNKLRGRKLNEVLDVATGTADLALAIQKRLNPGHVTGVDISEGMLDLGRKKIQKKGLEKQITLMHGDSENLPFEENRFDAVTVAFGVRNFENLAAGLSEMYRVLKPGGKTVILEFSIPRNRLFRSIFNFYFLHILPFIGRMVSKDMQAYNYLPESVQNFPSGPAFIDKMKGCGFTNAVCYSLGFGIASIYTGEKQE